MSETYTATMRGNLTAVGRKRLGQAQNAQKARYERAAWFGPVEDAPADEPDGRPYLRFEFMYNGERYAVVSSPAQDVAWEDGANELDLPISEMVEAALAGGVDFKGPDGVVMSFRCSIGGVKKEKEGVDGI